MVGVNLISELCSDVQSKHEYGVWQTCSSRPIPTGYWKQHPSGNFLGLVVDCCPYTHATHTTSDQAKVSEHEKACVAVPQMFITTNNLCNYNRFILFHISLGLYLKSSFMFLFL
uniref:(California timema) hypothetical protein n=1 Tax=Timema californicum TaxID=61474 RepID=A0A7R9PBA1_TIMCA|nr:unnamed protein product [Timema californicum]